MSAGCSYLYSNHVSINSQNTFLWEGEKTQMVCKQLALGLGCFPFAAQRFSRRPSAACATALWSCRRSTSCVATPSTSTALRATRRPRPSAPPAPRKTAKSWTCCALRTRRETCMIILPDRCSPQLGPARPHPPTVLTLVFLLYDNPRAPSD